MIFEMLNKMESQKQRRSAILFQQFGNETGNRPNPEMILARSTKANHACTRPIFGT